MKRIVLGVAFATALAGAAWAGGMDSRIGNTTIATDANGVESRIYYNADGTLTGKQADQEFEGTWKLDGTTICLTTDPALPDQPNPLCVPFVEHAVGDTWTVGEGAQKRTITIVAGIQ